MKSKSMRFRWMSNLKKWVVNNLCCVLRKKNRKRERCEDTENVENECGDMTVLASIDLSTMISADIASSGQADLETEMAKLKLQDLRIVSPLGAGGFGRVILNECGDMTVLASIDLSTMTSADIASSGQADLETEMAKLKLQDLRIVSPLGAGGFGRVILVQEKNETYALKILNKQHIVAIGQQKQVLNEKNMMAELRSDFIVRLHTTFKDDEHLYLLMEPCLGGELLTLLCEEKNLSNTAATFYTACIVEALSFMHSREIIHRDLKPENVLLDSRGYAKLIDFGMSKKVIPGKLTHTLCGTPFYMAPEMVLKQGHNTAADIWSLGALVFEMLTGSSLFADKDNNDLQTCYNILQGINDVVFPNEISKIAEDFIRKLCRNNPINRLSAEEIPMHGWFNGFHWEDLRDKTMEPPFIPKVESPADTSNFNCENFPEDVDYPSIDDVTSWDPNF